MYERELNEREQIYEGDGSGATSIGVCALASRLRQTPIVARSR